VVFTPTLSAYAEGWVQLLELEWTTTLDWTTGLDYWTHPNHKKTNLVQLKP